MNREAFKETVKIVLTISVFIFFTLFMFNNANGVGVPDDEINEPPVPIISFPKMNDVYNTRQNISFIGSESSDPDMDPLQFRWILDNRTVIGETADLEIEADSMDFGVHTVTLFVSDGEFNVTAATVFMVEYHLEDIDTDNDEIPDVIDDDDDNDGLLDSEEDQNNNGIFEYHLYETDQRDPDTDGDGVSDLLDDYPLDPGPPPTEEETLPGNFLLIGILAIVGSLIMIRRNIVR